MKHFLLTITKIAILLSILNFALYFMTIKPVFFKKYKSNTKDFSSFNTFIIGDSHAEVLKHYPNIYGMFNFSNLSENYLDMYLKTMYLVSNKLKPNDTIIIAIDNHCLSTYRDGIGRLNENIIYAENFKDINPNYLNFVIKLKKYFFFAPLIFPDLNIIIKDYLKPRKFDLEFVINNFSDYDLKSRKLKALKRYRQQYVNNQQSKEQLRYLKLIVDMCKNKQINLIGIKFPISKEYHQIVKNTDFGIMNFWSSQGLRILDFQNDFFESPNLFKDEDHLNTNGAKLLSKKIYISLQSKL